MCTDTPRLFRGGNFEQIIKRAKGKTIEKVDREGKNICLRLSGGETLAIHLMMSGKLLHLAVEQPSEKHIHFWIKLSGGKYLALHDIRKFGWVRLLGKGNKFTIGPDALAVPLSEFKEIIRKRKGVIKNILLNQKLISGIGNIYSDEILWHAEIHPLRRADSLTEKELKHIHTAVKKVLRLAIKKEGTSFSDYRKPDGSEGGYFRIRKVYAREGEKCSKDGTIMERLVISQRSACFCPKHQK